MVYTVRGSTVNRSLERGYEAGESFEVVVMCWSVNSDPEIVRGTRLGSPERSGNRRDHVTIFKIKNVVCRSS